MKILIVSAEVWQDSTNGGNVLSNMFFGMECEFAQIYCNPGEPQNAICRKYYQITDGMVIRNFLRHKPIGKQFELHNTELKPEGQICTPDLPNRKFYEFFHKYRLGLFYAARHIAWNLSNWKNEMLQAFLDEFQPDIIFAPCYGDRFLLRLTRYLAEYTGKKIISYISDDSYTLNQFSLSPYFWINRFIVRRELRRTFPYYSLVYTMTQQQLEQCKKDFNANMKILRKSTSFGNMQKKDRVNEPIRIVYAGGIYLNRWKTLRSIVRALKIINQNGVRMRLDVYTGNEITSNISKALNDGKNSFLHKSVSQSKLAEIYSNSDIALHVESLDLKNRLLVRFSFSTKIVDCLSSGCAVMAICDKKQGGYLYLKEEDAAICISRKSDVKSMLEKLADHTELIIAYAEKAKKCCLEKHNRVLIREMVTEDFEQVFKSSK